MEGGYARGVRKQAARQARAMVELLGHHPSIVRVVRARRAARRRHAAARWSRTRRVPTWGKEVLDRSTARAIARVRRHPARRPQLRRGRRLAPVVRLAARHARRARARDPRRAPPRPLRLRVRRAVGARARRSGCIPERWPRPRLGRSRRAPRHGAPRVRRARARPPTRSRSTSGATRRRRTRPRSCSCRSRTCAAARARPCGGFAVFCLADPSPGGRVRAARPRARPRSARTPRCATRAGPCSPMVDPRTGNVHVVNDTPPARSTAPRSWSSVDGRVRHWRGDIARRRGRVRRHAPISTTRSTSRSCSPIADVGRVANRYPLVSSKPDGPRTCRRRVM